MLACVRALVLLPLAVAVSAIGDGGRAALRALALLPLVAASAIGDGGRAAFQPGLYGLNPAPQLFRLQPNGAHEILSDPLPYLQAQQLSCVDAVRGIFYFIGYSQAASAPYLVGLSLFNGSTLTETPLPEFYDSKYVGIGQYVTPDPTSARVFVGGQDVAGFHIIGLVTPGSGEFTVLSNLTSTLRDVFGGTCVAVPETKCVFTTAAAYLIKNCRGNLPTASSGFLTMSERAPPPLDRTRAPPPPHTHRSELWFELDLDIMILNLATKKVEVLPVSEGFEILGMNRDPATGVIFGLGGGPGQGVRSVVALHAGNRTIVEVGTVPEYGMQMGGITALDWAAKSIFWLAQKANADPSAPWYLVQNAVQGGKTLSAAPMCGNGQLCPWSLHYA